MNDKEFKKGIEDLKKIHMTNVEKTRILENVFSTPIRSPYMRRVPIFAYVYSLIFIISFSGITYVSGSALPGDVLYPIKTNVVESVLDVINRAPEDRIVWEEEKVERRIVEAEVLAKQDKLDDEKLVELEKRVERSSIAFAQAANIIASSSATSTTSAREKAKSLKQGFRKKIDERREIFAEEDVTLEMKIQIDRSDQKEVQNDNNDDSDKENNNEKKRKNIKRLKDAAIKVLDDEISPR